VFNQKSVELCSGNGKLYSVLMTDCWW